MQDEVRQQIAEWVREETGRPFEVIDFDPCGGGSIHEAGICCDGHRSFFVKFNRASFGEQFAAEASALEAIRETGTLRVPGVVARGVVAGHGCLVLEALDLVDRARGGAWRLLGRQLAAMHGCVADHYGWHRDNFIGATPQSNRKHVDWVDFFIAERLLPQFEVARQHGYVFLGKDRLVKQVKSILAGHQPPASLLHGDLWSGNVGFLKDGEPVVFDPASYYGDRETDLAFTEFFGGFPREFYDAYEAAYPLDDGYLQRRDVYNLYHVLNHANLFGSGYARQAEGMIEHICA